MPLRIHPADQTLTPYAPSLAVPDPVDYLGLTPLCVACALGNAQVAGALLDGGANIDFSTPHCHQVPGFTPIMFAVRGNHPGVVKLLRKRGADETKTTNVRCHGVESVGTALDIARLLANRDPAFAETLAVLRGA
jgi:ankyrin repeat protein